MRNPLAAASLVFGSILALGTALAVTACSNAQVATLCAYDAALQPIAGAVVTGLDPAAAVVVDKDNLVIHPAVLAACAVATAPVAK